MEKFFIIAFDSGAKGTAYEGTDQETVHQSENARYFDLEKDAKEYMEKYEIVGWVETVEI